MALPSRKQTSEHYDIEEYEVVWGDVETLSYQFGGDDSFTGEDNAYYGYTAFGDGITMAASSRGGRDTFQGGSNSGYQLLGGIGSVGVEDEGFYFGEGVVLLVGDAATMSGTSAGGADTIHGGNNSINVFSGDALAAFGSARGGSDVILGGDASAAASDSEGSLNLIMGDAYAFGEELFSRAAGIDEADNEVLGGRDLLVGGDAFADAHGEAIALNLVMGDAYALDGHSKGAADQIIGGSSYGLEGSAAVLNLLGGDGYELAGDSVAEADVVRGGNAYAMGHGEAYTLNLMTGDGYAIVEDAVAANDLMVGGNAFDGNAHVMNLMAGDAFIDIDGVVFGDDKLIGGDGSGFEVTASVRYRATVENYLYGDVADLKHIDSDDLADFFDLGPDALSGVAAPVSDSAISLFGDDTLTGGNYAENTLVGDGPMISDGETGGNDLLVAGGFYSENLMLGDAWAIVSGGRGGNDKLVSGAGDDIMWGDAVEMYGRKDVEEPQGGADRFVFRRLNGNDAIMDFREEDGDKIDLSAFRLQAHFRSFTKLMASGRVEQDGDDVIIHLTAGDISSDANTLLIANVDVSDLESSWFIF